MNLTRLMASKLALVLVIVVHWVLDDVIPVIPDSVVWAGTKGLLNLTGNAHRFTSFKTFWTKEKDSK